ncbi:cell envelope integrity protein CreD [Chitinophaga sp. Cy-1792]|uniref:cell envelope integrity protein CreD n=1 Tax=Chitinophaga sp. Cy-1792 TaxID=2608339 RepID=UPI001421163F|nr:cell envelope integrity protein CreD [Chitinophaga sp. Cy-1792]NIG52728.1 cell envelope integrity protein CreD [Chitinophaga sp. Cy-1792]
MENEIQQPSFYDRFAYALKAFIVFVLILVLLIPIMMVSSLVDERGSRYREAAAKIGESWGQQQTITGPLLAIPAKNDSSGYGYVYLMPRELKINGEVIPQELKRGIYNVNVYTAKMQLSGSFSMHDLQALHLSPSAIQPEKAVLALGLADLKGLSSQVKVKWNDQSYEFGAGTPGGIFHAHYPGSSETMIPASSGIQAAIPLPYGTSDSVFNFTVDIALKGSTKLVFSPVGKSTVISINSSWPSPSFDDVMLPVERKVTDKGFTASWEMQDLKRDFPQTWIDNQYNINKDDFGVSLITPVDTYQQTSRSVKYAFLLICLTFFVYYIVETAQQRSVHPVQYGLIGIALCIFYVLLLSVSEQLGFGLAYLIASVMTIGLISAYTASVLSTRIAISIGAVLALIYAFVYIIISAEDYALLMGSFGLFITLAGIMFYSRKINWNRTRKNVAVHS